jgi:hypothetical protein
LLCTSRKAMGFTDLAALETGVAFSALDWIEAIVDFN